MTDFPHTPPKMSWTFSNEVNAEIRRAAATGIYDIRGGGSKRQLPHFDDLLFLGASISRYPLEGYREKCGTDVWLRNTICQEPYSFRNTYHHRRYELWSFIRSCKGSVGAWCERGWYSLRQQADGGMTEEERGHSTTLDYQYIAFTIRYES